ncbi:MAG TPA: DUF819 family protein [Flavilitoribacter sp.]|nr:DUF819 family protein [Flavilitoribacter sp.]
MKQYLLPAFLTFTILMSCGFLYGNTGRLKARVVPVRELDGLTGNHQRITPLSQGNKFFLDKTDGFILEIPSSALPDDIAGMQVISGPDTFSLTTSGPIVLEGFVPGEPTVKLIPRDLNGAPLKFKAGFPDKVSLKLIGRTPVFKNDAIVLGILILLLALVFWTERQAAFKGFYKYVPSLLLCYFLPSIFNSLGIISGEYSGLYTITSRYLLPACLILLCISIDFKGILNLGPKALIMFLAATLGIILGGPVAILAVKTFAPGLMGDNPQDLWKGMSTIAGSWIGGAANQAAMKQIHNVSDNLFGTMIIVDVVVANIWMGFLLYGAKISGKIDRWLKADNSAVEDLRQKVENYQASVARIPGTTDLFMMLAAAFGGVALAHWGAAGVANWLGRYLPELEKLRLESFASSFLWLVVIATTLGLVFSFMPRIRQLEGVGASKWGSVFIYLLVATIGMKMDLGEVYKNLGLFAIGIIWMGVHVGVLLVAAKLIRAPFFFVAVGSQANVGGAASAPVVASAFSPALAPVGALLAVLGYALGTYGAIVCALLMKWVS